MERKCEEAEFGMRNGIKIPNPGRTVSDAVHPRFDAPSKEETEEFQQEHHYYCPECQAYMAPTPLALREHFSPKRTNHYRTQPCVYCKQPVYKYILNNEEYFHHDCPK